MLPSRRTRSGHRTVAHAPSSSVEQAGREGIVSPVSRHSVHISSLWHTTMDSTPDTGHRIQDTEQSYRETEVESEILATRGAGRPSHIKLASLFQTSKSTVKLGKTDKSTDKSTDNVFELARVSASLTELARVRSPVKKYAKKNVCNTLRCILFDPYSTLGYIAS